MDQIGRPVKGDARCSGAGFSVSPYPARSNTRFGYQFQLDGAFAAAGQVHRSVTARRRRLRSLDVITSLSRRRGVGTRHCTAERSKQRRNAAGGESGGKASPKEHAGRPRTVCPLWQSHGVPVAARVRSGGVKSDSVVVFIQGKSRTTQRSRTDPCAGRRAARVRAATGFGHDSFVPNFTPVAPTLTRPGACTTVGAVLHPFWVRIVGWVSQVSAFGLTLGQIAPPLGGWRPRSVMKFAGPAYRIRAPHCGWRASSGSLRAS